MKIIFHAYIFDTQDLASAQVSGTKIVLSLGYGDEFVINFPSNTIALEQLQVLFDKLEESNDIDLGSKASKCIDSLTSKAKGLFGSWQNKAQQKAQDIIIDKAVAKAEAMLNDLQSKLNLDSVKADVADLMGKVGGAFGAATGNEEPADAPVEPKPTTKPATKAAPKVAPKAAPRVFRDVLDDNDIFGIDRSKPVEQENIHYSVFEDARMLGDVTDEELSAAIKTAIIEGAEDERVTKLLQSLQMTPVEVADMMSSTMVSIARGLDFDLTVGEFLSQYIGM